MLILTDPLEVGDSVLVVVSVIGELDGLDVVHGLTLEVMEVEEVTVRTVGVTSVLAVPYIVDDTESVVVLLTHTVAVLRRDPV